MENFAGIKLLSYPIFYSRFHFYFMIYLQRNIYVGDDKKKKNFHQSFSMCVCVCFLIKIMNFLEHHKKNREKMSLIWNLSCCFIRWNVSMNSKECVKNIMYFGCRSVFHVWTINCRPLTFIRMFFISLFSLFIIKQKSTSFFIIESPLSLCYYYFIPSS